MKKGTLYYIANIRYPTDKAHGIQVANMCEAFGRLVEKVVLIVPRRRNDPEMRVDPYAFYGTEKTYGIRRLPTLDLIGLIPIRSIAFLLQSATYLLFVKLFLLFKPRRGVIVYTRELEVAVLARFLGFRSAIELHSLPRRSGVVYRSALHSVSSVLAISRGIGRTLVKRGYLGRVLSVPDGVKLSLFTAEISVEEVRREFSLEGFGRIALYAGHLYAWKGMQTALDAASHTPDITFCFAGGTEVDRREFSAELEKRGAKNCRLLGRFSYTQVPRLLRTADVLILPNTGKEDLAARFTSPLKLFEYMASGVPIVAADVPAIREIVDDSMVFFFHADDPADLARAVRESMADPSVAEKRAHASRAAVQQYGWDSRAVRILKEVGYV